MRATSSDRASIRRALAVALLCLAASPARAEAPPPSAAEQPSLAVVTAARGTSQSDGAPVHQHLRLPAGARVETSEDAAVAILLEGDALLSLGEETTLALPESGPSLGLERGRARIQVAIRDRNRRLQVVTPAARITPIAAVVHVEVDEETGLTRVTCLRERARVASADPELKRSVILNAGQQVAVRPGAPPGTIRRVGATSEGIARSPYERFGLREAALAGDGLQSSVAWLAAAVGADVPPEGPPPVAAGLASRSEPWPAVYEGCSVTSCSPFELRTLPEPPPVCTDPVPSKDCLPR